MTSATEPAPAERQEFTFQTEIKQLLQILSHSLYQNREIAIRELVSNASDALNKLRHVQMSEAEYRDDAPLEIKLVTNKEGKTLTIQDNGIGLTRDELIQNLGTIAHSGSLDYLSKLAADAKKDVSLIGQFGVGFYSAFMLADKVEVRTRSYKEESGWCWISDGSGQYTIEAAPEAARGASVILHLKEDCVDEFTNAWSLKQVIRRYSTFVPHPVLVDGERANDQQPIWVEPKSQVTEEQYDGFYQWLTHRKDEKPLWKLHLSADSPLQFQAILYCPRENPELQGFGRSEHGISLCAKRILVQDDNQDLLPEYLGFLYGLVDSADLPLNVSRETLQDSRLIGKLRRVLTKKVLDYLAEIATDQPETYKTFYEQFGTALRGGAGTDFDNREKVAALLRFPSSNDPLPGALTSLDDYVKRMREDQEQIYYLAGPDRAALLRNPNYESFRKRELEVLFLTDPVDEFALSHVGRFGEKSIVSIDSAEAKFPASTDAAAEADKPKSEESTGENAAGFDEVLKLFKEALGDRVEDVRKSTRLTESPVGLVNPSGSMSSQLQKVLSQNMKNFTMSRRIMEVNPDAPLIKTLSGLASAAANADFVKTCGQQLYANAMLLDGLVVDPDTTVRQMQQFMEEAATQRSAGEAKAE